MKRKRPPRLRPLLTVEEVADHCQKNEKTVRRWIKAGELKAARIGREYRVSLEDLQAFLNEHRV